VNNGTLRYTGLDNATGTAARRAFTVGSGGARLEAEGGGLWTIGSGGNATYNQIVLGTNGGVLTLAGSQNGDFQSYVTGSGSVVKSGAGTWTFGSTSATENNTYSGDTTLVAGTLQLRYGSTAAAIPSGAAKGNLVVSTNGVLDLNGVSTTVNGLSGNGTIHSSAYGAVISAGGNDQTSTFAGLIEDGPGFNLSLTKVGAGALSLNGTNTYTGPTTVNAGTLNGTGSVASAVTVNSGGALGAGTASTLGTLTINNTLTFNPGATNYLRLSKTGGIHTNDVVATTGLLSQGGTLVVSNVTSDLTTISNGETFTLFNAGGGISGSFANTVLPNLPVGWVWDTTALATSGQLRATNAAVTLPVVFTPPAGAYLGAQSVTISCGTPGATIYYTTNGTTPTTTSLVYAGPITLPVNTTLTLKAYAHTNGFSDSAVQTAPYVTQASAIWSSLAGGSWPVAGNWQNAIVGQGSSVTANFSTLMLNGDTVVTLDSNPTTGTMVFGDANSNYNWTVEAGSPVGTLTLNGTNPPTIAVLNQTLTIAAQVAGTNGLTKTGNGTLTLTSDNTYTGGTIVNGGTLNLGYANSGAGTIVGALTVNAGATALLTVNNALGYTGANWVTNINLNGGTLNTAVASDNGWGTIIDMTGGTLGSTVTGGYFAIGQGSVAGRGIFNVHATNISSVIGADLTMRQNAPLAMLFNVERGTAATDLEVSGSIRVAANGGLVKSGAGIMRMDGVNTYTGATVVSNGTLIVNGSLVSASALTVMTSGTLAGTGNAGGSVALYGTNAPGGSVIGTFNTGGQTWYPGSVVICKLASTNDDSASRDQLVIGGTLDLSQLSGSSTATIKLVSMLNSNTLGNMSDFDPAGNYTWTVGSAGNLNPLDPSAMNWIVLDASAISNPHPGTFSLSVDIINKLLLLNYAGAVAPTAPSVTLASPTNSQYFNAPATIPMSVIVTNNGHTVNTVTYYTNGVAATAPLGSPFSTTLSGVAAGGYNVWAVASYDGGAGTVNSQTNSLFVLGALNITSKAKVAGGNFQVSFTGPVGQTFTVKGTNAVNAPFANWKVLTNGTIGAGGSVIFTDTAAPANSRQFYRIVSP
jgi:autotransporter-associated beta strand protein